GCDSVCAEKLSFLFLTPFIRGPTYNFAQFGGERVRLEGLGPRRGRKAKASNGVLGPKHLLHMKCENSPCWITNRLLRLENRPMIEIAPARTAICPPSGLVGADSINCRADRKILLRHVRSRIRKNNSIGLRRIGFRRSPGREFSQNEIAILCPPRPVHWQVGIAQHFQAEPSDISSFGFNTNRVSRNRRAGCSRKQRLIAQLRELCADRAVIGGWIEHLPVAHQILHL